MRRKKLLVIIVLLIATIIIYAVVLYRSIQVYEDWKQAKLEEYPPEMRPYVDFHPYTSSRQGNHMMISWVQ